MSKKRKLIVAIAVSAIIFASVAFVFVATKTNTINHFDEEIAIAEYKTTIGDVEYNIDNAVQTAKEIVPAFSAGMIPIRYNGVGFEITTRDNENWYDYTSGKPAYIMLNDGYYKSEIEQGIEDAQLMKNAIGKDPVNTPTDVYRIYLCMDSSFCV